jgi:DNA-binding CsgD family transcriptional regulator
MGASPWQPEPGRSGAASRTADPLRVVVVVVRLGRPDRVRKRLRPPTSTRLLRRPGLDAASRGDRGLARPRARPLNGDTLPDRGKPLTIDLDRRRLVVTRVPGGDRTLLLAEAALPSSDRKPLSQREWEVVDLLAAGKSNAEIAVELWIASGTVRTHLENIYAKLGVHSRTAALARVRDLRQGRR